WLHVPVSVLNPTLTQTSFPHFYTALHSEEGGNITVKCSFYFSRSRKLFCKEKCENGNILVETSDDAAQNGRYSIKYENKGFPPFTLYVSITQLKQSDSGWYRCSLDKGWTPHLHQPHLEVQVCYIFLYVCRFTCGEDPLLSECLYQRTKLS
uniref:Immunoglobulin subtype domain-containing protein n=1 Tax=Oreochromis aureus TaxID=47969 RepID=A0A668SYA3_OREAU